MVREELRKDIITSTYKNILCELPTSYGKSKIAIELVAKRATPNSKILVVVPRNVLKENWRQEFIKWNHTDLLSSVEYVTYVSFPKVAGEYDFIIFDEAHHLSDRCIESLKYFKSKNNILLSATVKRDIKDKLFSSFPHLKVYKISSKDAIAEGVLPDPKVFLIPLTLDNILVNQEIIKNKTNAKSMTIPYADRWKYNNIKDRKIIIKCTQQQYYDSTTSYIEYCRRRIYDKRYKNIFLHQSGERLKWLSIQKTDVVRQILLKLKQERTLTFCSSIIQTQVLGAYCINSNNRMSSAYLNKFNNGEIKHITACNMIDEGVNLRNCKVGVYATLNSSERMIVQKLGRILRHSNPVIIIPYYKNTRDEEIVQTMCENYNPELITTITNLNDLKI